MTAAAIAHTSLLVLNCVYRKNYIRVINYHGTPRGEEANFRRQLEFFRRKFEPAGYNDVISLAVQGESWRGARPGVALTFDDGLLSNYETAAPILEEKGFQGWFFVPVGLIGASGDPLGKGPMMDWGHVRDLAKRGHVIGVHTYTHPRLARIVDDSGLGREVGTAKKELEANLGGQCTAFCWVGGELWSYSRPAAEKIRNEGYLVSFMTCSAPLTPRTDRLKIHRVNIESDWTISEVQCAVCGLNDIRYRRKRRQVEERTQVV